MEGGVVYDYPLSMIGLPTIFQKWVKDASLKLVTYWTRVCIIHQTHKTIEDKKNIKLGMQCKSMEKPDIWPT